MFLRQVEARKAMTPLLAGSVTARSWEPVREKGLRVLPIMETVENASGVRPYEDAVRLLDSFNYFVVTVCPCKHIKNLDPDEPNCPYPAEVCLHFDKLGHYIVDNGLGREITKRKRWRS